MTTPKNIAKLAAADFYQDGDKLIAEASQFPRFMPSQWRTPEGAGRWGFLLTGLPGADKLFVLSHQVRSPEREVIATVFNGPDGLSVHLLND